MQSPVQSIPLQRYQGQSLRPADDLLVVEEPLEIRLIHGPADERTESPLTLTMRTPGHDHELATGFLRSEGIITGADDIVQLRYCEQIKDPLEARNVLKVTLRPDLTVDLKRLKRHFYSTASCGVCGKTAIEDVFQRCPLLPTAQAWLRPELLGQLSAIVSARQTLFTHTGGLHAAALFSAEGELLLLREDVGRHNAVDKLLGAMLHLPPFDIARSLLFLSGRAGFELIQKAIMAGIPVVAALGAPTSLAVQLSRESGQSLIGFLRAERFNVYCGEERLLC